MYVMSYYIYYYSMLQIQTLVIGDSHIRRIHDIWKANLQHTQVHWRYKGGAGISWLRKNLEGCEGYDAIIISCGGNDLDNGMEPATVASQLIEIATYCADKGVRTTIVMALWPREDVAFTSKANETNMALEEGLHRDTNLLPTVFWKQERRLLFDFYDGVHLRHYNGPRRYLISCIMWADKQLRANSNV